MDHVPYANASTFKIPPSCRFVSMEESYLNLNPSILNAEEEQLFGPVQPNASWSESASDIHSPFLSAGFGTNCHSASAPGLAQFQTTDNIWCNTPSTSSSSGYGSGSGTQTPLNKITQPTQQHMYTENAQIGFKITQFDLLSTSLAYAYNGRSTRDCKQTHETFAVLHGSVHCKYLDQVRVKVTAYLGNAEGTGKHETARFAAGKHKVVDGGVLQIETIVYNDDNEKFRRDYQWKMLCQGIEFERRSKGSPRIQEYELKATVIFNLLVYRNGVVNQIAQNTFVSKVLELHFKGDPQMITKSSLITDSNGRQFIRQLAFFDSAFDPRKYQLFIELSDGRSLELNASIVKPSENKLVQAVVPIEFMNEDWIVKVREHAVECKSSRKRRGISCTGTNEPLQYVAMEGNEVHAVHAAFKH